MKKQSVMVIDDDVSIINTMELILEKQYKVIKFTRGIPALKYLSKNSVDLIILDLILPDINGLELLPQIKQINRNFIIVILTALDDLPTAANAMRNDAFDFLSKPFNKSELLSIITRAAELSRIEKDDGTIRFEASDDVYTGIITVNKKMQDILERIKVIAKTDSTILVTGESGTGKELIAKAIHNHSNRKHNPFVTINCGAIPSELLESELFGHTKGSFSGAYKTEPGKFEIANKGTIFLDEITSLHLKLQAKLLRAIQEKEIERIGEHKVIKTDVRIISATNIDLLSEVRKDNFREDLYYRLNVIPICVPPLREKKDDIPILTETFLKRFSSKFNKQILGITHDVKKVFVNYLWPGNIRELENLIERLVVLAKKPFISLGDLPLEIIVASANDKEIGKIEKMVSLDKATGEFEKNYLLKMLNITKWSKQKASKLLGVHRNTLNNKLRKYKIQKD